MIEHDEVRELLELAAVEPGGLDRLESGDTTAANLVVGHLAGCPDCLEEMARLRRADTLLRPILASQPDPALRERTLAFVRDVGVARGPGAAVDAASEAREAAASPAGAPAIPPAGAPASLPEGEPIPITSRDGSRRRSVGIPAWAGTLAAALVIGVVGGALLVGSGRSGDDGETAAALQAVVGETASLMAADDVVEVALLDASGEPDGTLVVSPSVGRILVAAVELDRPAAGMEYRCWATAGDARTSIGTLRWTAAVAWWTGEVRVPDDFPSGVVYSVSLAEVGSSDPGTVVLTGGP